MAFHEKFTTSIKEIVDYYLINCNEEDLACDISEIYRRCWRCGEIEKLCRCHIIPSSRGGEDRPENFVLLCRRCHEDAPNCVDDEIIFDWLKAEKSSAYNMFWANSIYLEYKKIYNQNIVEEFNKRVQINEQILQKVFFDSFENISTHLAAIQINNATWVGIFKMAFDTFDSICNK